MKLVASVHLHPWTFSSPHRHLTIFDPVPLLLTSSLGVILIIYISLPFPQGFEVEKPDTFIKISQAVFLPIANKICPNRQKTDKQTDRNFVESVFFHNFA